MSWDIKDRRIATHFETSARWTDGKPHCLGIFYEPHDIDELVTTDSGVYGPTKEEAERLVACWNAFLGVPTEQVASARASALEEAAKVAEEFWGENYGIAGDHACSGIASAIRALKEGT